MTPKTDTALLPNNARSIRETLGFSVVHVAYHTGLTVKTIERIELGKNRPRLENAIALAKLYQRRLDEVFPEVAA